MHNEPAVSTSNNFFQLSDGDNRGNSVGLRKAKMSLELPTLVKR